MVEDLTMIYMLFFLITMLFVCPIQTMEIDPAIDPTKDITCIVRDKFEKDVGKYSDIVYQRYPINQKYVHASQELLKRIKVDPKTGESFVKFKKFNTSMFAFMMPCLKLNHHLSEPGLNRRAKEEAIQNFNYWLETCAEENLVDVFDVTNTLDLSVPRMLALRVLYKKLMKSVENDKGIDFPCNRFEEKVVELKRRPLSMVDQELLQMHKNITIEQQYKEKKEQPSWFACIKNFFYGEAPKTTIKIEKELPKSTALVKVSQPTWLQFAQKTSHKAAFKNINFNGTPSESESQKLSWLAWAKETIARILWR